MALKMILEWIFRTLFDALYDTIKESRSGPKDEKTVEGAIIHNNEVYQQLREVFSSHPSDRLHIVQYHNGNNYYNGRSIQKCSYSYELKGPGIASEFRVAQNIPTSEDPEFHATLYAGTSVKYPRLADCPNLVKRYNLAARGIKSYYAFSITDLQGNLLGYVGVAYIIGEHDLTEDEEVAYSTLATHLAGFLASGKRSGDLSTRFTRVLVVLISMLAFSELIDIIVRVAGGLAFIWPTVREWLR